jgi:hypothetical protein
MPLAGTLLALALSGCGDSGPGSCPAGETGTPPNCTKVCPTGTLPPDCRIDCTTTNVYQSNAPIPASSVAFLDFSVPDTGRLDVTVDWTNASSPVGFYLVPANTCTTIAEFNGRTCNFIMRSEPPGAKPRRISQPNLAAGNYRWLIANFASSDESVALQIVLSKGSGCPAFGQALPTAQSRTGEATLQVDRARRQPF